MERLTNDQLFHPEPAQHSKKLALVGLAAKPQAHLQDHLVGAATTYIIQASSQHHLREEPKGLMRMKVRESNVDSELCSTPLPGWFYIAIYRSSIHQQST